MEDVTGLFMNEEDKRKEKIVVRDGEWSPKAMYWRKRKGKRFSAQTKKGLRVGLFCSCVFAGACLCGRQKSLSRTSLYLLSYLIF